MNHICRLASGLPAVAFLLSCLLPFSAESGGSKKPSRPAAGKEAPAGDQVPARGPDKKPSPSDDGRPDEPTEPDDQSDDVKPAADEYAPPAPWLQTAKFLDYVQYTSALRAMLLTDWLEPKTGPRHAQFHFESATKLCRDDPRLSFAYGLLLWKHEQSDFAIKQFEQAAATGKVTFLPALQASGWCRLVQRDVNRGGTHLVTLARILAAPHVEYPSTEQKQRAANWLGETMGYLTGAGRTPQNAEYVSQLETTIEPLLEGPWREAYDRGRENSIGLFQELQAIAARPEHELRRELGDRRRKLLNDLTVLEPELLATRDAVKLNRDTLAKAERDQRLTARQYFGAVRELQQLSAEIESPSIPRTDKDGKERNDREETRSREEKRSAAVKKYKSLQNKLPKIDAAATTARQRVADIRKDNQRQYRQLHSRLVALNDRYRRLKPLIRQHEEWEKFPERFKEHIRSLPPYVPWSVDDEKELVLNSYPRREPTK